MKDLKKQIEELIENDIPQNIKVSIPINEDNELKAILIKICEKVEETNEQVKNIKSIVNQLLWETQQSRTENWYRGMF